MSVTLGILYYKHIDNKGYDERTVSFYELILDREVQVRLLVTFYLVVTSFQGLERSIGDVVPHGGLKLADRLRVERVVQNLPEARVSHHHLLLSHLDP